MAAESRVPWRPLLAGAWARVPARVAGTGLRACAFRGPPNADVYRDRGRGGVACLGGGPTRQPGLEHLAPQLRQPVLKQPGERVTMTLDAAVQAPGTPRPLARQLAGTREPQCAPMGARAGVIDNASGDVLAYVGLGRTELRARRRRSDGGGARRARQVST